MAATKADYIKLMKEHNDILRVIDLDVQDPDVTDEEYVNIYDRLMENEAALESAKSDIEG